MCGIFGILTLDNTINIFENIIQDVKVYSNNDYINNHLRYLYDIGLNKANQDSRVLYNQVAFANACNFNNVYVYVLPRATKNSLTSNLNYLTPSQKSLITSSMIILLSIS